MTGAVWEFSLLLLIVVSVHGASAEEVKCLTCFDPEGCSSNHPMDVRVCNEDEVRRNHLMFKLTNPKVYSSATAGPFHCFDVQTSDHDPVNGVKRFASKGCTSEAAVKSFCQGWIEQLQLDRCVTCSTDDGCENGASQIGTAASMLLLLTAACFARNLFNS
ncbi:uncharacterized protein LOC129754553 [Uranotaenia lowii]|uniref:uncharacterized protein LOC129754553 n=1 Tax=Uranotaenia lowii TaxID=190385 RepID=UPI00247A5774|nr:uncharacterized protein LOC129754553 [Uranotaenia lowii]